MEGMISCGLCFFLLAYGLGKKWYEVGICAVAIFSALKNLCNILLHSFFSCLLGINSKINELGAIVTFWRVNLINSFLLVKVTNEAI